MKGKLYLKIVVLDDFSNFSKSSFFKKAYYFYCNTFTQYSNKNYGQIQRTYVTRKNNFATVPRSTTNWTASYEI
jgi:hypothetical protein